MEPSHGRNHVIRFLEQGFEIYIIDCPGRGRSRCLSTTYPPLWPASNVILKGVSCLGSLGIPPLPAISSPSKAETDFVLLPIFSAKHTLSARAIKRRLRYQDSKHFPTPRKEQEATRAAVVSLLDRIAKSVIIIGQGTGGTAASLIADARPSLVRAIILLQPSGPPFVDFLHRGSIGRSDKVTNVTMSGLLPLGYDPDGGDIRLLPGRDIEDLQGLQLVNLVSKPILIATYEQSSSACYDYMTRNFYTQAGCKELQHLELIQCDSEKCKPKSFIEVPDLLCDTVQPILRSWILQKTEGYRGGSGL